MLKNSLFFVLVLIGCTTFTSCKKDVSESIDESVDSKNQKIAAGSPNQFVTTGNGYSNTLATINTKEYLYQPSYAWIFRDTLQIGIAGTCVMKGVTKNVEVHISSPNNGVAIYPIGNANTDARVEIVFMKGTASQHQPVKTYKGISGTLAITKLDANTVEGTYSGTFMVNGEPTKIVKITKGKFFVSIQ